MKKMYLMYGVKITEIAHKSGVKYLGNCYVFGDDTIAVVTF